LELFRSRFTTFVAASSSLFCVDPLRVFDGRTEIHMRIAVHKVDTHDAAFASCGAEAKVRSSSCGVSRHASRRQPLVCQWHLNGDGSLTCTWTPVPPAPISTRQTWSGLAPGNRREPSRSRSRLHPTMQSIAIAALIAATLFGLFICFTREVGDFL
jgi:hypothetical protein